uniref:Ig-like domain-containing protein n=1 Tax=Lepisosteus oculatus TaxID=7918 RepID=W5M2Q8_LEPOC
FKVIVPAEPVDTTVGSSIVLPCRLSPEMSAAAMEVRWFKENFDNLVFLYKEGKETEGSDYRSRVRLFRQEMERGNVSLLLQNVRISDQGLYKCHVSSVDWYEEPQLQLRVTRTFKLIVPSEPVAASVASDVVLPCQLSPEMSAAAMDVRWYRENFENLVFLYKEGKETEGSGYRGRVRLFKQEMERGNVSLLLQNVRISDQGSYTCHV